MTQKEVMEDSGTRDFKMLLRKYIAVRVLRIILLLTGINLLIIESNAQIITRDSEKRIKFSEEDYYYTLIEATKQYVLNNYSQAINLYIECLKVKPGSAAVNFQLSQIMIKAGDVKRAKEYAKRAYQNDSKNKWYIINLINIYRNVEEIDSAIYMLKRLSEIENNGAEYKYLLAELYEMKGDYNEAIKYVNQIEAQIGISKEINLIKYRLFRLTGEKENALKELKKAKELFSDDYMILGMIAEYYRDIGNSDSAKYYYDLIVPGHLDDFEVAASYGEFLINIKKEDNAQNVLIEAILNNNIRKEIKISYLFQVIQDPKLFDKIKNIADTLSTLLLNKYPDDIDVQSVYADIQYRSGNYSKTAIILKNIIEKDRGNYIAWEQLIHVENSLGRTDSVIKYSIAEMKIFRTRPLPYLYLGSAYYQKENYQASINQLKIGIEYVVNSPVKVQYYNLIAESYHKMQEYDSAWRYYEYALHLDPQNLIINNNYAYYLAEESKDLNKALLMSEITIKEEPENTTYLDTYGWILFKLNKVKKAKKIIERALEKNGRNDAEIMDHYGEILFRLRKYNESLMIWKSIINVDENKKQEILKKIENAMKEIE